MLTILHLTLTYCIIQVIQMAQIKVVKMISIIVRNKINNTKSQGKESVDLFRIKETIPISIQAAQTIRKAQFSHRL